MGKCLTIGVMAHVDAQEGQFPSSYFLHTRASSEVGQGD